MLLKGDCLELIRQMPDNSVDSIVTDPPYELGFMGKSWDNSGIAYSVQLWTECLRVLKPGGHLLAFGGSRTYHRLACAVEDAGFEVRDQIMWLYGSGFPKSLDVSKAIDKLLGGKVKVGKAFKVAGEYGNRDLRDPEAQGASRDEMRHVADTDAAQQWSGWGTALKPAHEPIVVARKPLTGTVANNVLEWGTGALNIDASRVGEPDGFGGGAKATSGFVNGYEGDGFVASTQGRWPANVIHDGSDEVLTGFPTSKDGVAGRRNASVGMFDVGSHEKWGGYNGEGSAARFFYCAKASKSERNAGLEGLPEVENRGNYGSIQDNRPHTKEGYTYKAVTQNIHPTVKPIALMRYLVKMVTPPNGVVLDPFLGSGTTAVAATLEGFQWIGCELTPDYWPIIEARTEWAEAESAKISPSQPKLF